VILLHDVAGAVFASELAKHHNEFVAFGAGGVLGVRFLERGQHLCSQQMRFSFNEGASRRGTASVVANLKNTCCHMQLIG
jgi:hypothetical protein